jgi:hypothetical protein
MLPIRSGPKRQTGGSHTNCAAFVGPLVFVQFLSGSWPGLLRSVTRGGLAPLHCASESQPPEVLRYLADMRPRALEMARAQGALPIHYPALRQSSLPSVRVLVEAWPDSVGATTADGHGYVPLHVAVARMELTRVEPPLEIVQYLAEASPESLRVRDASGRSWRARCDAPLDVIFALRTRWPECRLSGRHSDDVHAPGSPRPSQRRRLN